MHASTAFPPTRQRFPAGTRVLPLLLHQDGSTTRLLEALSGGPVTVHVLQQHVVAELPAGLRGVLPGSRFLRRLTSLTARGHVLLDSIGYIAIDTLPAAIVQELEEGQRPIGHLLAQLWTRRRFRSGDDALFEELWHATGEPDATASRSCIIDTPQGACMVLGETFRQGIVAAQ
jgi:chorismate-pyruvate lyase